MNRMPKIYSIAIVALALLLAVSVPAARADHIRGTVLAVDGDDQVFLMTTDDGRTLGFRVCLTADVRINNSESTLWNLQPGTHVTVDFRRNNMELIADGIRSDQP